jgi:DNA-binding GntR family transcriptional regulator
MPVPDKRAAIERRLLRDTAYVALCDAIVDGTLAPGETLHDDELCAWLGLSRTPIRGALVRLEDEGLVECAPQRFTRVMPLDAQCARDLFPVLAVLHGLATELGVPRMTQSDLQSLNAANDDYVRALRAVDGAAAYDADERFHAVFLRAAGNDHVLRMVERLAPQLHRLERQTAQSLPGRRSVAQHQALVARAAAGDAAAAVSAAQANWMTLGALIERVLSASAQN